MQQFLSDLIQQQYPFVLFRFPGETMLHCYYQTDDTVHWTEDYAETGFAFAPFRPEKKQLMIPATHHKSYAPKDLPLTNESPVLPQKGKTAFIQAVATAVNEIASTRLEKVVLSNAFDLPYTGEGSAVLNRLANTYPNAFVYYWFHPKTGQWLGASPEQLIQLNKGKFSTVALAGTLPSGGKESDWTKKEIHEQQVVVSAIVDGLKQSGAAQNIHVGQRSTVQAGKLFHLQTPITAEITAGKLCSLLTDLHPTPAVGGLPKQAATAYILERENYSRENYTGFLGPFSKGNTAHFFVNLRCAKLTQTEIRIYAGAGITAGSVPANEWDEICRKANTFLAVL